LAVIIETFPIRKYVHETLLVCCSAGRHRCGRARPGPIVGNCRDRRLYHWSQTPSIPTDYNNYPTFSFTSLQSDTTVRYFANLNAVPVELKGSSADSLSTYLPVGSNNALAVSSNVTNSAESWADQGLVYSSASTKITFIASNGYTEFSIPLIASVMTMNGGWGTPMSR
jgi:hypothetical protein